MVSIAVEQRPSALAERIAAGLADPISDEERRIVAALKAGFEKKYGRPRGAGAPRGRPGKRVLRRQTD